ncbi:MAG: YceI family protein [Proteiniphilum sp.]|nr:YceI family protein [Proteiniphilum sp.]
MKTIILHKRLVSILLFTFLMAGTMVNAQTLTIKSSTVTIDGETNVKHDFTTKVTQLNGKMTVTDERPQSLTVEIPVRSIISGEKLMDKKTHETFNASKHPMIQFNMTELDSMQVNADDIAVTITGNLSMGGTTKKVTLKADGKEVSPGVYTFEGALPLKMSEFNMKAPTAMLGAMKTKDQVTVNYKVTFEGPAVQFNLKEYTQIN